MHRKTSKSNTNPLYVILENRLKLLDRRFDLSLVRRHPVRVIPFRTIYDRCQGQTRPSRTDKNGFFAPKTFCTTVYPSAFFPTGLTFRIFLKKKKCDI